jgi:hypothetical protein
LEKLSLIIGLPLGAQSISSNLKDRLNEERLADMTPEVVAGFVREMEDSLSTVTAMERARVVTLLFKQVQKDNNLSGLLFEKFEAHLKLIRYEQRAFNQIRKRSQVKK